MVSFNNVLKDAGTPGITPCSSGVYILRLYGMIMKVGSAEIGIQKRMQQYYNLNPYCGLNSYINVGNRDQITVDYQLCNVSQCEELESKLFDKYGPIENLPWAQRRPHSTKNTCPLLI